MKVLDFDRARAEVKDPTILRAFGGEYPIPSSPPVGFTILYQKILEEKDPEDEFTRDEMLDVIRHAVGSQTFDALMVSGMEKDDMQLLLSMLGAFWRGDDEGEAPAPAEGAGSDTSENTGES